MNVQKGVRVGFIMILLFTIVIACNIDDKKTDYQVLDLKIDRFEKDLFDISAYHLVDSVPYLERTYPDFFPVFCAGVIEIGTPENQQFNAGLLAFTTDFTIYRVSQRVEEVFPDLVQYEKDFGDAFGRYEALFPGKKAPRVISCISGFNQSVITAEDLLAISLDKYLGPDDDFYKLITPPVPEYLRKNMRPEKIVSDALKAWIITEFPFEPTKTDLVSNMIHHGRALYCLKELLPESPDTLLFGFTNAQLNFCLDNEQKMWEYMAEHRKLFVTDAFTISQFVNEAPFTKDFSQESPGQAAVWLGYRIVESYMKHTKEIDLEALMHQTDYHRLLNTSKYNP